MKVKCVRTKISEFPFKTEAHLAYFRSWLRGSQIEKGFDDLIIGDVHVVYAVRSYHGYPFYFVKTSASGFGFDFHLQPSPCFEIVDNTPSKLWFYKNEVHIGVKGKETFCSTLAIKEWVEEDGFLHRLVDGKPRELEIWAEASTNIELEG